MCSTCFPRSSLPADASLPSTGSSGASSPASSVLPKRYDFLPPIPPRFVAFAWRYLSVHSFFSLPGGRVRRRGLELVTRYLRPGLLLRKRQDLPSSWGTPIVRSHMFSRRRQDRCTRPLRCSSMALGMRKAKAPTKGLSTLNSMAFGLAVYASQCGLPRPTQDSLPAAGQALPDGLSTRKIPLKGFRVVSYISSPFPKLLVAISSADARCHIRATCVGPTRRRNFEIALSCPLSSQNFQKVVKPARFRGRSENDPMLLPTGGLVRDSRRFADARFSCREPVRFVIIVFDRPTSARLAQQAGNQPNVIWDGAQTVVIFPKARHLSLGRIA